VLFPSAMRVSRIWSLTGCGWLLLCACGTEDAADRAPTGGASGSAHAGSGGSGASTSAGGEENTGGARAGSAGESGSHVVEGGSGGATTHGGTAGSSGAASGGRAGAGGSGIKCGEEYCSAEEYCRAPCNGVAGYTTTSPPSCSELPARCEGTPTCECICGGFTAFCTPGAAAIQCGCG